MVLIAHSLATHLYRAGLLAYLLQHGQNKEKMVRTGELKDHVILVLSVPLVACTALQLVISSSGALTATTVNVTPSTETVTLMWMNAKAVRVRMVPPALSPTLIPQCPFTHTSAPASLGLRMAYVSTTSYLSTQQNAL